MLLKKSFHPSRVSSDKPRINNFLGACPMSESRFSGSFSTASCGFDSVILKSELCSKSITCHPSSTEVFGPGYDSARIAEKLDCGAPAEIRRALLHANFDRIRSWDATPFFRGDPRIHPGCRTFYVARKAKPSKR